MRVSFSKFVSLRPKECILAGASGTHAVCVCLSHQNFKFMLMGAKITPLVVNSVQLIKTKDFKMDDYVKCHPSTEECHFRTCIKCLDIEKVKEILNSHFNDNYIKNVVFKQ